MSCGPPLWQAQSAPVIYFVAMERRWAFWPPAGCDYPIDMADAHPATGSAGDRPDNLGTTLRTLPPIEEKVVRLSYGIGCERAHSVAEIAVEFGVGADLVAAILEQAEQRLAECGVPREQLQHSGPPVSCSRHRCGTRSAEGD